MTNFCYAYATTLKKQSAIEWEKISTHLCQLFVNLTKVPLGRGTSTEKMPTSKQPVGETVGHSLDN